MLRLLIVAALAASLLAQAAHAQDAPKKCPTVHHGPIAIFIEPTHEELEALKKERGADDFSTIADDVMWYDYQATKYLDEKGIPYCSTTEEHHEFVTADGRKYTADRECPYWCMILWNGHDEPVYTDSIDIDVYGDYLRGE